MFEVNDAKDKWHLERWTKFTASEWHKLLGNDRKGNIFGEVAWGYIEQKALEMCTVMWERPELEENKNLLHGKMYEYPAYKAYIEATRNYSMKYLGSETPLFLEYEALKGESGGSPDIVSINSSNKVDAGAEIKCPKNPMNHFKRLKWKNQWDIKEGYIECYTQIQALLLITSASIWQFISFDERMKTQSAKVKVIDVVPDRKFQDNLDFRLRKAIEEKYKTLDEYMNS